MVGEKKEEGPKPKHSVRFDSNTTVVSRAELNKEWLDKYFKEIVAPSVPGSYWACFPQLLEDLTTWDETGIFRKFGSWEGMKPDEKLDIALRVHPDDSTICQVKCTFQYIVFEHQTWMLRAPEPDWTFNMEEELDINAFM